MRVPGFPGFSYARKNNNKFILYYRENGESVNRTYKTYELLLEKVKQLAPGHTQLRCARTELDREPVQLQPLFLWYPQRLLRSKHTAESKHIKYATSSLRRMSEDCHWNTLDDITSNSLDDWLKRRTNTMPYNYICIERLKTFLKRVNVEFGHQYADNVKNYRITKPDKQSIHLHWTMDEQKRFWDYLVRGMEILAAMDPHLSWHERIQRCCHSIDFSQRMRIIPLYALLAGAGIRPSEGFRMDKSDWNFIERKIILQRDKAKTKGRGIPISHELGWILDVCSLFNGNPDDQGRHPLFISESGNRQTYGYFTKIIKHHLAQVGLGAKMLYDTKYNLSETIYHLDLPQRNDHEERMNVVGSNLGHTKGSKVTARYLKDNKDAENQAVRIDYFNSIKLFPFPYQEFPVKRIN